jgi:hypothetical protein
MVALLGRLWAALVSAAQFLFPVLGKAGRSRELRWALHIALVVLVLVALFWVGKINQDALGRHIHLDRDQVPFYLPALALAIYGLLWLGWWLWTLLTVEQEESPYPDIDTAWDEARRALEQAGYSLDAAPLFLVFGKPAGTEEALFEASGMSLPVKRVPPRVAAPLHLYAGRDAIFVTCAGASLLGQLADLLAGVKEPVPEQPADAGGGPSIRLGGGTLVPDANIRKIMEINRRADREGRKLNEEDRRQIAKLLMRDEALQDHMLDKAKQSVLKDPHRMAEAAARLRRLCQLIARDRRPFCPVNGLLFLIPVGGAASEVDASLTGEVCQRDFAEARRALQVDCPVLGVLCDMEKIPGFREFRDSFDPEQLQSRLGQRYQLVPDLDEGEIAADLDGALEWIGNATIPGWVYKFFDVESGANREEGVAKLRKNARLYQFMGTMRERTGRLRRILTHGLLEQKDGHPLFAGCYAAGTGRAEADQAFIPGIFRVLTREQDNVAWTRAALEEEEGYHRMRSAGMIVLGVLAVLDVALVVAAWLMRDKS